jgi:hypothetical protein
MTTSITKANEELTSKNNLLKKAREKAKEQDTAVLAVGGAGIAGGNLVAALIDEKWAANDTEVAEVKGFPVNAIVGGLVAVGCVFAPKFPGRHLIGFAGAAQSGTYLYHSTRKRMSIASE